MSQSDLAEEFFMPAPFKLYRSDEYNAEVLRVASRDGHCAYLLARTSRGMELYAYHGLNKLFRRLDLPQSCFVPMDDESRGWTIYLCRKSEDESPEGLAKGSASLDDIVFPSSYRLAPYRVFRREKESDHEPRPIQRLWQGLPTDYLVAASGDDSLTVEDAMTAVGVPDLLSVQFTLEKFGEDANDAWHTGLNKQIMLGVCSRLGEMSGYLLQVVSPTKGAETAIVPARLLSGARIALDIFRPGDRRRTDLPIDYGQRMILAERMAGVLRGLTKAIEKNRRNKRS